MNDTDLPSIPHNPKGTAQTVATPANERLIAFLVAGIVVAVCLLAGELVLRQWFPLGGVVFQRDARYLFKFIPNSRKLQLTRPGSGGNTVLVTINSQGRRG